MLRLLESGADRRRRRTARGSFVLSDVRVVWYTFCFVYVVDPSMASSTGSVTCHVDTTFSRAARISAEAEGERCVCCSRMCCLFGGVNRLDCVCDAIRACQFDWIRVMSRRRVESGADLRRSKDGERWCACYSRMWCWLFYL